MYRPDIAWDAATTRLRDDENGSIVAVPGAVNVNEVFIQALPVEELPDEVKLALGDPFNLATNQLVTVDTIWEEGHQDARGLTIRTTRPASRRRKCAW